MGRLGTDWLEYGCNSLNCSVNRTRSLEFCPSGQRARASSHSSSHSTYAMRFVFLPKNDNLILVKNRFKCSCRGAETEIGGVNVFYLFYFDIQRAEFETEKMVWHSFYLFWNPRTLNFTSCSFIENGLYTSTMTIQLVQFSMIMMLWMRRRHSLGRHRLSTLLEWEIWRMRRVESTMG